MPSTHNSRSRAKKNEAKERKALRHGARSGHSFKTHSSGHTSYSSYLSRYTAPRMNMAGRTFGSGMDPLDLQLFDYIIVVDVEATCEANRDFYPNEVIELPGVLIDVRKGLVDTERSFRSYVKPWRNPKLTEFCTSLTGITQEDVDGAPDITEVIKRFVSWYKETIPKGAKCVFAADGPWDFKKFIYEAHVLRDHVSFPSIFYEYLDIRTTFSRNFNHGAPMKLDAMLRRMNLKFEGRPHCGFDDAVNIARLCVAMMKAGCIFDFLCAVPLEDEYFFRLEGYPVYRREEGSGRVDRDVVDDIAKTCFGEDYFTFGDTHRQEVQQYRAEHPHLFKNKNVVMMKRKAERKAQRRARMWMRRMLCLFLFLVLCAVAYIRLFSNPRRTDQNDTL